MGTSSITSPKIAYNPNTDQIKVGKLLRDTGDDWTLPYEYTMGGAYVDHRHLQGKAAALQCLCEFVAVVARDGVSIKKALSEFMLIDEFRASMPDDMPH